jgi:hypothetical protein
VHSLRFLVLQAALAPAVLVLGARRRPVDLSERTDLRAHRCVRGVQDVFVLANRA